jgi:hypothetical protein
MLNKLLEDDFGEHQLIKCDCTKNQMNGVYHPHQKYLADEYINESRRIVN